MGGLQVAGFVWCCDLCFGGMGKSVVATIIEVLVYSAIAGLLLVLIVGMIRRRLTGKVSIEVDPGPLIVGGCVSGKIRIELFRPCFVKRVSLVLSAMIESYQYNRGDSSDSTSRQTVVHQEIELCRDFSMATRLPYSFRFSLDIPETVVSGWAVLSQFASKQLNLQLDVSRIPSKNMGAVKWIADQLEASFKETCKWSLEATVVTTGIDLFVTRSIPVAGQLKPVVSAGPEP